MHLPRVPPPVVFVLMGVGLVVVVVLGALGIVEVKW